MRNTLRAAGSSDYGPGRIPRVLFDILTIRFLLKYFTRPMRFFGAIGLAGTASGAALLAYCLIVKLLSWRLDIIHAHGPLLLAGALLFLAGLMMFSIGLIGELVIRTYFQTQDRRSYAVREILTQRRRERVDERR
jgi:hypothetical protein